MPGGSLPFAGCMPHQPGRASDLHVHELVDPRQREDSDEAKLPAMA